MYRLGFVAGLGFLTVASMSVAGEPDDPTPPEAVMPRIVVTPNLSDSSGDALGLTSGLSNYLRGAGSGFPGNWDSTPETLWNSMWIMDVPSLGTDVTSGFGFIGGHWAVFIEVRAPIICDDGNQGVYFRKAGQNLDS